MRQRPCLFRITNIYVYIYADICIYSFCACHTQIIVPVTRTGHAMTDEFRGALERVLEQSQRRLHSEILVLLEDCSPAKLQSSGNRDAKLTALDSRQLGHDLRELGASDDLAGADNTIGILPGADSNNPNVVPMHSISGRRSVTYDLARKASAHPEVEAARVASKRSVSLTDVLTAEMGTPKGCIGMLVSSWQFEAFFATVILTNSIFIGVVLQWESENRFSSTPRAIVAISIGYGALFTAELLLRMMAAGLRDFYCKANWAWNVFDTLVVASVLYEFLMDTRDGETDQTTSMSSNLRTLRVVRLTRLTRIVRVFRLARFLRPLRTLVQSILGTLKALIWSMLLLTLINYVFAAIFTDIVGNYTSDSAQLEADETLQRFFGTLQSSSLTLFMSISGGLSWNEATYPLRQIGWLWIYIFCIYVAFCLFALLNAQP